MLVVGYRNVSVVSRYIYRSNITDSEHIEDLMKAHHGPRKVYMKPR